MSETLEEDPSHMANKLRLGIHYVQCGADQKAQNIFTEILKDHPDHLDARMAWASMYASDGSLNEAIDQLIKARVHHPKDSRVLFGLGYCYERKGRLDQALEFYQEGSACRPYLRQFQERSSAIHLYRNDTAAALEQFYYLQREHPEDVWVYLVLGGLHLKCDQFPEAIAVFEKALTIEPDNFDGHNDTVEKLVKSGEINRAIACMEEVIRDEHGDFASSYVRLADLLSQVRRDEDAVRNYQQALEIHPGYLEAAVKLGTQHMRMQRFYESAEMFNCAVEINDRIIAAYIGLGVAQKLNGHHDLAADTFDLAGALEPNTNLLFSEMTRLQMRVAMAQGEQGLFSDYDKADMTTIPDNDEMLDAQITRHKCFLKANPDRADLHYNYAILLRGKGQTDPAIKHLRLALDSNPVFQKARIKLALALREMGHHDESDQHFVEALHLDDEHKELHYKLGVMYCDRIQFALAVEHFEMTGKSQFENNNIHSNLTLALQNMGLVDRAAAAWRAVCELDDQSVLAFQSQRAIVGIKHHVI
ncbi:MAG: tetratricopeptide repeat protein [Phycisphaerae bacterium]|nr:tetratricopeptide repeat protein [Phycisphaerae bacterium]